MHTADPESVEVGRVAWEMAEFEIHYLRGMVASMLSAAQLARRSHWHMRHVVALHQQSVVHYRAAMQRALLDRAYRCH